MSEVTMTEHVMSETDAARLTARIALTAGSIREGMEKLQGLVAEAKAGNAHVALGYRSWTTYLADVLGKEPLRLDRDERQELVGYLAGEGMSTRAIAPIVGVSVGQVHADRTSPVQSLNTSPVVIPTPAEAAPTANDAVQAVPQGESSVLSSAPRPAVTGMDGKTYTRRPLAEDKPPREGSPRTNVVAEITKAITAAEEGAEHAARITREHLTHRTEEATVWTRRLSAALEALERLNTSLREASL